MRDFKGMKRQRGRNRKPGGNQNNNSANPNRSWDSQGPENIKVRGNAQTVYERYQQLARDATSSGDRVLAENYLQHAEHYFRVLRALQPQRSFQEIAQREQIGQGFDIDFEDESGAQAAAFLAAQQAADRQAQQGQGGHNQGGQNQGGHSQGGQGSGQNNGPNNAQGGGQGSAQNERSGDDNDNDNARRESRRDRWERRRDSRRGQYERDESEGGTAQAGDEPRQPAAKAEETTDEQPRPRRRGRAAAAESDTAAETTLPGFLTRATPAPAADASPEIAEDKPAPRRRAPRRKAETPVDEQA